MADTLPDDPLAGLDAPARDALAGLALGALARSRTWVADLLASPAVRTPGSVAPSQELVRHTLATLRPRVEASRMVREYIEHLYVPAARSAAAVVCAT